MKQVTLLLTLLSSLYSWSQVLPTYYDTIERKSEYTLNAAVDYAGTAIHKDISSKFIRGGFIDQSMKDYAYDRHTDVNRMGLILGGDFCYTNFAMRPFKKKLWGFSVQAGANYFGGLIYGKDLFGLTFYGNERFLGDTLDLSGANFNYMAFQKVGFGLIHNKKKNSISLNVYNVSNAMNANLQDFKLIQSEDGSSVSLIMNGNFTTQQNLKFNQGLGVGVDINYYLPIDWHKDRRAYVKFTANNIGFAYMYEDQTYYSFDTTINFSGFTFEELISDNGVFSDSASILDTLGIRSIEKNNTRLLPGFLEISKIVDAHQSQKVQSFFGVRMYPTLIYSPYAFAGLDYRPVDWLNVGVMASYGGFAKFRGGLYVSVRKGVISAGAGTENIVGMVSKRGSGESLFIRLKCVF